MIRFFILFLLSLFSTFYPRFYPHRGFYKCWRVIFSGDSITDFAIVRLDKKGRILIPYRIRKNIEIGKKSKCVLITRKNEMTISPIEEQKVAMKIVLKDVPGSLAGAATVIARKGINIVTSQSRTIESSRLAEWDVVLDAPKNKIRELEKNISGLKNTEDVFVEC